MAKRAQPRIIIKEYRPWRGWLFNILLWGGGMLTGWLLSPPSAILVEKTAEQGQSSPQPVSPPLKRRPYLEQENIRLRESVIRIQQELEVEQQTRADLSANLIALQDEILELKRQLATYKRLAKSLQEQEQGLHIEELTFTETATERLLRYRLVLTQGRKMDQFNRGKVELTMHGIVDGKSAQFGLDTLSKGNPLMFRFKYFQILEGELLLPPGFKPTQVEISLVPQGTPSRPIAQTFDWDSLIGEKMD